QNHYTHGIEIVTCSFCSADEEEWGEYDVVAQSADILVESYGLVMCVSAGNYGPDSGTVSPPGTAKWAITVGWGTDPWHGGWSLHPNSSRGPCEDGRIKPDILAPGTDIRAAEAGTTDSHIEMSGTSMATPFVAGMAALWLDRDYSLRYAVSDYHEHPRVKKLLMASAHDMPEDQTPGLDDDYGAGRVSASKQHGFYTDDISSYKDDAPTVLSYSWLEQSYNHNNEPLWVYDPEDGEDWYRVQCYSGLFIAVSADGDPDLILRVRIWNKYSQIVASSYPGNYRSIGHWAQYSGEYYIQVVVEEYSGDYYDIDIMTTPS
ncbi:MAG: S8 family serine peptidase, partial [Promethearchaeia archaeon]